VFVMVVCFWRTDTTCYGSLHFNSGDACKPVHAARGVIVAGSKTHPRGTQSISGFPKDDSHGTGGGFFARRDFFLGERFKSPKPRN
jgi:hypothetical protein